MKNIGMFALLFALVTAGAAFAADAAPVAKTTEGVVVTFTPAVAAVAADTAKNTAAVPAVPAKLVVTVAKTNTTFELDAKVVVTDKNKKVVDLAALKAGAKVSVSYTEANKVLTAVAVTLQ